MIQVRDLAVVIFGQRYAGDECGETHSKSDSFEIHVVFNLQVGKIRFMDKGRNGQLGNPVGDQCQ
jgi:hypothetical protein